MLRSWRKLALAVSTALMILPAVSVSAQQAQQTPAPEDSFASENAILDTSILFAIGAREARQELRGAFGWPTFQEGLVEGVYFRFDPDGYARFAPSPRLDSDVFEVICRPRTHICMGRKGALQVTLNNRGQIQLVLENVADSDKFSISEGISELPLPQTLLQPLEPRLEILLASGGELIGRRGDNEIHRISLAGFAAVIPYLRWVAARQDYTVLPRGWPVPNAVAAQEANRLTQPPSWQSPMPQPHVVTQTLAAEQPMANPNTTGVNSDVAEVRGELNVLRELLLNRQGDLPNAAQVPQPLPGASFGVTPVHPTTIPDQSLNGRLEELQNMANLLQSEIARLHGTVPQQQPMAQPQSAQDAPPAMEAKPAMADPSDASQVAKHLEYLMTEIGLAPDVALMIVQQQQQNAAEPEPEMANDTVVNDILQELRAQIPTMENKNNEYQLLTDYFQSVTQQSQ